ncbi:MAG: hybrid sensor histidine kinase/response regulator, partial [Bacteroidota bacterium]|nr:hybrid sensor histidine kinase/response regulator [Bacteroidota bacterium]MDX5430959.1 hybrid sensor histidine kinase/response regulator [Bacteroidota bacterium]MDX5469710.1 hybrid sensor histidine kinase/response regulator [Bacteroidota bacterium]
KGSEFWFEIALEKLADSRSDKEESTPVQEESLEGMEVLIVEDNVVNVFVCQNFLNKWVVLSDVEENGS